MSTTPVALSSAHVLPPGPIFPAWWQLIRFAGDPLRLLDECHRRYGDTFTLDIAGYGQFVMISDLEAVRDVFRGDPDVLHSGEANALLTATVGRHSVLVLDGAPHARQRRILVPPLKGERMRSFFDAMRLETLDAARSWPRDAPMPALPIMRRITVRVILRTALGLVPGPEMDRFERKIEKFLSNGRQRYALVLMTIVPIDRLSGSRWVPLFRQLSDLDDDLFALIAMRRRGEHQPSGENVLDDLLAAKHEDGSLLDDREIRDARCITILIAGHDTTGPASRLGPCRDRAAPRSRRSRGRRVASSHRRRASRRPNTCRAARAPRRGDPREPATAPRRTVRAVRSKTVHSFQAGGREYLGRSRPLPVLLPGPRRVAGPLPPSPTEFRPERFQERKFGPHEWFPFGGGNRVCLGMPFALYEMGVLLATLFSQVRMGAPLSGARSKRGDTGSLWGQTTGARVIVRDFSLMNQLK